MDAYRQSTAVIDWGHPDVLALARTFNSGDSVETARRCFEWVRDQIRHSGDFNLEPVTCAASAVLRERSGFCYAKSHLLAALLRANGIPAGLCYQRLSLNDAGDAHCLHGLNAVFLPEVGWYRVDPRGNRAGLNAQFDPPFERLAFTPGRPGEFDLPGVLPNPLPVVVHALQRHSDARVLLTALPDLAPLSSVPV